LALWLATRPEPKGEGTNLAVSGESLPRE